MSVMCLLYLLSFRKVSGGVPMLIFLGMTLFTSKGELLFLMYLISLLLYLVSNFH